MSLLQNPSKVLDQIDWYLDNQAQQTFTGAFLNASGNLSRQLLEQVLFILAFYSGMPTQNYMRPNRQLKMAANILKELRKVNPNSGHTYLEDARRCGPRIQKFARYPRSLDKWRRELNSTSHYRNPSVNSHIREKHIRAFSKRMRMLFDEVDSYLITAAVNEILSKGKVRVHLANDAENTPGVIIDIVVSYKNFVVEDNRITLKTPVFPIRVLPDDEEVPLRWTKAVILVQHTFGMQLNGHLITKNGDAINLTSFEATLRSFSKTARDKKQLQNHFLKLGCNLQI